MKKDKFTKIQEPNTTTEKEVQYRNELETYFKNSIGTNLEKLENFAKYVPRQSIATFLAKYEIFKKIINVQGSIIECGVYNGGGLMAFAQLSAIFEPVNNQRKIIGFDTFAGFTELSEEDKKGTSVYSKKGGFAADSYEDLKKSIELYDANRFISHYPRVVLVKGDAKETLPKYLNDNPQTIVSLLYLDFDVFEPTKIAIELLKPRMPKGAVIVFDELNADTFPGETLAVLKTIGVKDLRIQRFPFDSWISYVVL